MTVINHSFIEEMIHIIIQETYLFTIKTNIIEKNIFVHYYTISKYHNKRTICLKMWLQLPLKHSRGSIRLLQYQEKNTSNICASISIKILYLCIYFY
ncbi:hypothetical protein QL285_083516 [Trifolium repens]|nr:hypothetical protein QL285_083516 [Trifolium repens]